MGCGQSKKIHLYPKKNKRKSNGKKEQDDSDDEKQQTESRENEDDQKEKQIIDDDMQQLSDGDSCNDVMIPMIGKNGPILQSPDISSSQQNFFKMLDQKIDQGPDYDSSSETELALEEARLISLVQHWENSSLSASCSSASRSLQNTPVRQNPMSRQHQGRPQFQQPLNAELLTHQQQLQHQAESYGAVGLPVNSPQRVGMSPYATPYARQQLLTQSIVHQTYGVQPQAPLPPTYILAHYQNQQSTSNMQMRPIQSSNIPPHHSPSFSASNHPPINRNYSQLPYHTQLPNSSETILQFQPTAKPQFPPAISVNQLTPQVQRQLRDTQELNYEVCQLSINLPTSSNATQMQLRSLTRPGHRKPVLETEFSQEHS